MTKLSDLIDYRLLILETEEKELPENLEVTERGYEFLQQRVAQLNKKAVKYKVPPIEILVIEEKMVKVLHPDLKKMQMSQNIIMPLDKGLLADPNSWVLERHYVISFEGKPPKIEGYEFVARLEHTAAGNFIYKNPKASVKNLPAEFKTMNQHCDFCKTKRDRNDTFVIRMEKDDPTRFPDKKAGDMLLIGRNCLSAFLPGMTIAGLVAWTKMVQNLVEDAAHAKDMSNYEPGMGGGGSGQYYEDADHLLMYLVATYLHVGSYISKKAAQISYDKAQAGEGKAMQSTLSRARNEMHPDLTYSKKPKEDYPIYFRLKEDTEFISKVEAMMKEFQEWLPKQDFDAMAAKKPEFADYLHNLKLVAGEDYLRGNHFGFFSGLFQLFIREKDAAAKKAEAEKAVAALPPSPVTFDATLVGKRLRDVAKEAEIKRLTAGGLDEKAIKKAIRGKVWGWEADCKKITEYEKTQTFGPGDAGIGYRIFFRDSFGNDFLWFASNNPGFEENGKYIIDGTITRFDPLNKYSNRPQTVINRVKIVKDFQHPEVPPQPDTPVTPVAPPVT